MERVIEGEKDALQNQSMVSQKFQKLTVTGDGSHSLRHETLNEHYHSQHGAAQESAHVFLKSAFDEIQKEQLSILEFGFGTGLNALLTLQRAEKTNTFVQYTSLEKFPLAEKVWQQLNYPVFCSAEESLFHALHLTEWKGMHRITPYFQLRKTMVGFEDYASEKEAYDIIYFDAFAPTHHPEAWSKSVLKACFTSLKIGGIWVSYCAQGAVRRRLQEVGFVVEKIQGPPGKREMLRGRKL